MHLFSLHPPKARDCFKPHFTTDKGNFWYCQQWCWCGGDLKGMSCHGNCTRPGRRFQSLEAHAGTSSQLSAPGWGQSKPPWVGLSTGAAGEVESKKKKNVQRWKSHCFFLHFFESLGIVCRGSVRSAQNTRNTHRLQPHFRAAQTSWIKVLRWVEELQDWRCFQPKPHPASFRCPRWTGWSLMLKTAEFTRRTQKGGNSLLLLAGFNFPISEPWAAALLLRNCGLAANNPLPSHSVHCRFMSTSLENNSALASLVPFQENPEPGNVAFQPELL